MLAAPRDRAKRRRRDPVPNVGVKRCQLVNIYGQLFVISSHILEGLPGDELGVLAAALAVVLGLVVHALKTGVAPAPTSARVASAMMALIPPGLEGVVFELGSGWGTLAFPLARRLPRCTVRALEISPLPWLFSRLRHIVERSTNLSLRRADYRHVALDDAALVVC